MPRYFFNIRDGVSVDDDVGTELADVYTAQAEAVRFAGEVLTTIGAKFWNGSKWALEVTDSQRRVLFILHFSAEERSLDLSSPNDPE